MHFRMAIENYNSGSSNSNFSDSSFSDSLFIRIIECRFCRRNRWRKCNQYYGNFGQIKAIDNMEFLQMLGEGGFGRVFSCRDVKTKRIVAVKQISIADACDCVPGSIIREISLLKELKHANIVRLLNVTNTDIKYVNLIFEYLDCDLDDYIIQNERYGFSLKDPMTIKSFLYQILSAVEYCHSRKVLHRDLTSRNLLVNHDKKIIKLADFDLAREIGDPDTFYTDSESVTTRGYRAPELLFGSQYSTSIDMWGVGCIFGEMVLGQSIFHAINSHRVHEAMSIFRMLGTPMEETWPGVSKLFPGVEKFPKFRPMDLSKLFSALDPAGLNLLMRMLCLDPNKRISAEAALKHAYFDDLDPVIKGKAKSY